MENPYRDYLAQLCEYCKKHPPRWGMPAGFRTLYIDEVYGKYQRNFSFPQYGIGLHPFTRAYEKGKAYVARNEFEIREFESTVFPKIYTVKVFRIQYSKDNERIKYCCARGASKRSIDAAYEPCCKKMISNFGIFDGNKSVEETIFRISIEE